MKKFLPILLVLVLLFLAGCPIEGDSSEKSEYLSYALEITNSTEEQVTLTIAPSNFATENPQMPRTSPVDDFLTPFTITLAPGEQHVEMVGQNFLVDGPEFVHMKSQPNLLLRSFYSLTIHPGTPKEQHFTYPIVLSEQRLTESAPNLFNPGLDDSQLQYRATWNSEGENLFSQSLTRPFFLDRTSVYGHLGRIIITSPDTPSSDIFFSEAMLDDPTRSELFPCTEPTIIQNRSTQVP